MLRVLLLLCLLTSPVWAGTVYHVTQSGSDAGPGTSVQPWRSVTKATQVAQPGDTVQIAPGTYSERLTFAHSGTQSQPITYVGTRSGEQWQTVIDGSTPVTATWTAQGGGVYTASLGYNPLSLSAGGLNIWRCGDHAMQSGACQSRMAQGATQTCNMSIGQGPCWDGVEALYGYQNGVTSLRFRNGEHPSAKQVRAGAAGATVVVNGQHYLTFKDLKIVGGGERVVDLKGGAQGVTLDGCYVAGTPWRVHLDGGVRDTTITRSTLTADMIGFAAHTPGDWNTSTPARIVNRWLYDTGKFLVGNSQTHDASILLAGASNTTITQNVLRHALAGITFYNTTSNTVIAHNQIFQHADNCTYIDSDSSSASFHHNLVYDCDHLMRFNSTHRQMVWDVYANRFWQAAGSGKHIFIAPPMSPPDGSRIRLYHNSHAGTGYAVDVGSDGATIQLPFVFLDNLLLSVDGLTSWGNVNWGHKEHLYSDALWYAKPMPTWILPAGHGAIDSAPVLSFPGMDATYYVDGRPDHGAVQAGVVDGGGGTEPPIEPPQTDTQAPTVTITAPSEGALISGLVAVTAKAADNVKVTAVEFFLDGAPRGEPQCCTSIDIVADSTKVPDGPHVLTATARDAANNVGTSAPVNVIVYNGAPEPPEPPQPTPGPHPVMACVGELGAKGAVTLRCEPEEPRR